MVNWFPGHMAKTRRLIMENIKLVDVVIELVDARLPVSSRNPLIQEILGAKPLVLVLNKSDLAEEEYSQKWLQHFHQQGCTAIVFDALKNRGRNEKKRLLQLVNKQAEHVLARRAAKGIKNRTIRLMILGIPNVGKSTLINNLTGRGVTETGDKPGVTKGKQWVRLAEGFELLDTPGILWPKFEDQVTGLKLAATGAIKAEVYDSLELAVWLLGWLRENKPGRIAERYQVVEDREAVVLLEDICRKRGLLVRGGEPDSEKGANIVLAEYRGGKLGKVTMDIPPELEKEQKVY